LTLRQDPDWKACINSSRATPKGKSCQQDYELKGFAAAMPSRLRLLGPIAFSPLPFRSTAMLEPCTCRHNRNFILARLKQMRTAERLERVASEAKHWNSICNALELEI